MKVQFQATVTEWCDADKPTFGATVWRLVEFTDPDCEQNLQWELYRAPYEEIVEGDKEVGMFSYLELGQWEHVSGGQGYTTLEAEVEYALSGEAAISQ